MTHWPDWAARHKRIDEGQRNRLCPWLGMHLILRAWASGEKKKKHQVEGQKNGGR